MNRIIYKPILWAILICLIFSGCKIRNPVPVNDLNIPYLENFTPDGDPAEWSDIRSNRLWANPLGGYAEPADLEACLKISWNKKSLNFLIEVADQSNVGDSINPRNDDAIEIFLSPFRGSENIIQISIVSFPQKDYIRITEKNGVNLSGLLSGSVKSFTRTEEKSRITEIEVGFPEDKYQGRNTESIALQAYVDDVDSGRTKKNQLTFYPLGQSSQFSSSMFTAILSADKQTSISGASRLVITDNKSLDLYVFGAETGDKIDVFRNGRQIKRFISESAAAYLPDTFDLTGSGFDFERDTAYIAINQEGLTLHELFLAPRLYKNLQEKRFERDIRNFVFSDRVQFPPENATLFIGSSSIVRWETLKNDFPELQVIKRGFNGSTSSDALQFINQIVLPYKPAKVVYYEGDNDIPMGISAEEIRDNVREFISQILSANPETRFYIISPKPSTSRMHLWEKYKETNLLLKQLADDYENVLYVDVASPMFDQKGKLMDSLIVKDGIHMNEKGYVIWTKVLRNALELNN